ncbi:MAG: single-stranded DNA-binding protein [Treponema sp.]|nr:single-stranded DNA-binding protein [Treponema sp.]
MNQLNSLLLEGSIASEPERHQKPDGTVVCACQIVHKRYPRYPEVHEEKLYITITAYGSLAEQLLAKGKIGRGLRVVGRFSHPKQGIPRGGEIVIIPEHIELRPGKPESNEEQESLFAEEGDQV